MRILTLINELQNDPLGRGYAGMTDAQVAADMNTTYREIDRGVIDSRLILIATDASEYVALTAQQRGMFQALVSPGTVDVSDTNVRATFAALFGAGTTTRDNLLALSTKTVSRAEELGLPRIKPGYIEKARLRIGGS